MENRNVQGRTLLPHQRKIWTEAFKASMHHTSIESAERKAWQAVDICERVGAFGEASQTLPKDVRSATEGFDTLLNWIGSIRTGNVGSDKLTQFWQTIQSFDEGEIDFADFKTEIEAIVHFD